MAMCGSSNLVRVFKEMATCTGECDIMRCESCGRDNTCTLFSGYNGDGKEGTPYATTKCIECRRDEFDKGEVSVFKCSLCQRKSIDEGVSFTDHLKRCKGIRKNIYCDMCVKLLRHRYNVNYRHSENGRLHCRAATARYKKKRREEMDSDERKKASDRVKRWKEANREKVKEQKRRARERKKSRG